MQFGALKHADASIGNFTDILDKRCFKLDSGHLLSFFKKGRFSDQDHPVGFPSGPFLEQLRAKFRADSAGITQQKPKFGI